MQRGLLSESRTWLLLLFCMLGCLCIDFFFTVPPKSTAKPTSCYWARAILSSNNKMGLGSCCNANDCIDLKDCTTPSLYYFPILTYCSHLTICLLEFRWQPKCGIGVCGKWKRAKEKELIVGFCSPVNVHCKLQSVGSSFFLEVMGSFHRKKSPSKQKTTPALGPVQAHVNSSGEFRSSEINQDNKPPLATPTCPSIRIIIALITDRKVRYMTSLSVRKRWRESHEPTQPRLLRRDPFVDANGDGWCKWWHGLL